MKKLGILFITICFTTILCSGCSMLELYEDMNEVLGDIVLTNNSKLKGTREFGDDHYTGTYEVTYNNFIGEEVLFGGTTLEQDEKNMHIKLNIKDSKSDIEVIMMLKDKEEILATKDGYYEFDFTVQDGSNYLIIKANEYSGKVNIEID